MRYRITASPWLSIIRPGSIIIRRTCLLLVCGLCLFLSGTEQMAFAQQVFSASSTTETTSTLAAFRTAIGGADNSTNATPQASGRREINWDAVRLDGTDFNNVTTVIVANKITGIPVNRFQARGVTFKEVFAVSNDGFLSANAGVANQFPAFSPANTFASFNTNKIDLNFVLPSAPATTPAAATTRAFGVIFLDVEQANTSSIEYFNGTVSLGKFFVPAGTSGQAQFLGVLFNAPVVTRVVITAGTAQIFNFNSGQLTSGSADRTNSPDQTVDQVATDDFIYAEPVVATASSAAVTFSGVGTTNVTNAFAAFRTAIGGADNSTNATPQTSGRREINWDAVQLDGTDFNNNTTLLIPGKLTGIPVNRFQGRGARFNRVLAVSNDGFASANPTIAGQFPAFSPANTFCSFEVTKDTVFVLASAPTTVPVPAATRGFGAIFLDVEKEHTSAIEYFNGSVSLGKFFVPKGANGETQFLGVLFSSPIVTRVALTTGNAEVFSVSNGQVIGGGAESETKDLVSLDDFIYAEPVLAATSTSAASYSTTAFAAESISAVFGVDLTTATANAPSVPLPTTLAGAAVKITDSQGTERLAPLFFVSPGQINYQIPPGTASGTALLTVTSSEGRINTGRISIETVAPGLFSANSTGSGAASAYVLRIRNSQSIAEPAITFDQAQQRFVNVPIDLGPETDLVYLVLYGTGIRFRTGLQGVSAKLGGNVDAPVLYAGGLTGLIGLDQINVLVPRSLIGRGEIDVALTVDGKTTNTVKVNIR
jgi:uncharacterized protein (TIGR03437 family)